MNGHSFGTKDPSHPRDGHAVTQTVAQAQVLLRVCCSLFCFFSFLNCLFYLTCPHATTPINMPARITINNAQNSSKSSVPHRIVQAVVVGRSPSTHRRGGPQANIH